MPHARNILIVAVIANFIALGLLWYGYTNIQNKKVVETKLQNDIAAEDQKTHQLDMLRETLAGAKRDRGALEKFLFDPGAENQIRFISQMEQLGQPTTGAIVNTTSLDLSTTKQKSLHGEFAISGTWNQLFRLLRLMEELPTHVVINKINISHVDSISGQKAPPDTWSGTLGLDIVSLQSTP